MTPLSVQVPFPVFQDRDGQPLENGYVWLGVANLNPQTNPVVAYYDAALTIVAAQPLRTLNGYISRAGTPAQVYVDAVNYSILVLDSKGSMVYNFPNGNGLSPDACGVTYNPPFTGAVAYPLCEKLEQTVSVKDFGAVGDGVTDDTAAFTAALTSGQALMVPQGDYKLSTWTVFSGANDVILYGVGKPLIEGPGFSGVGSANFIASGGNIHIEGIRFSEFISVCASVPTALNDYFKFVNNETSNTNRAINLDVNAIGGGYRSIFVDGNVIENTSYGAWLVSREMHNTIVTNNVFKNLGNAFGSVNNIQAVMVGLDTAPGTRLNAVVSDNIFQNIINTGTQETTAIMMHDARRCTVNGNVIDTVTGGTGEGIYLRRTDMDATCVGNTIVDVSQICISAKGGKSVIANNRISGRNLTPFRAIGEIEQMDCVIDGNWISNCYSGISSLTPVSAVLQSRVQITNNTITDCVRWGIYAAGRSRSQVVTGNTVKRITGGPVIITGGIGPEDINVGIEGSYVTGGGSRCIFTNNHVSQVLGSATGSGDGLASVAFRLRTEAGEIFAELNSFDAVEYGFWLNQTVLLQNNYLQFAALGIYHPSSTPSASSTLQTYKSAGLVFPSDNSQVVSDVNTLDFYREGTWTPSIGRNSTFGTYTAGANDGGTFTRIGNVVYWACRVGGTNTTASGGEWVIRGLPFESANNDTWGRTASNVQDSTGTLAFQVFVTPNSIDVNCNTLVSGTNYYASGFYYVS